MSTQTQTAVKRALLQIKTSDRNVKHRFRTHWETIQPRAFKKTTLLAMCKSLEIYAPIRLRKGDVFERLIKGLLLRAQMRGGEQKNQLAAAVINSKYIQLTTHTKDIVVTVDPSQDVEQPHFFDFDAQRLVFGQFGFENQHILDLLDSLDVPIYIVYDGADDMFMNLHLNVDIPADLASFRTHVDTIFSSELQLESDNIEIRRLFTSYILCKCIESYAIEQFPAADIDLLHADGAFALNYVFESLLHDIIVITPTEPNGTLLAGGSPEPSLFSKIFTTQHLKNAFDCFGNMQSNRSPEPKQWWRKTRRVAPAPAPTPAPPPAPPITPPSMHPANFIVQTHLEMICGFIAVLTMLSKSNDLQELLNKTLKDESDRLHNCITNITNVDTIYLSNRLENLEFILSNLQKAQLTESSFTSYVKHFFGGRTNHSASIAIIKDQIKEINILTARPPLTPEMYDVFIAKSIETNTKFASYIKVLFDMSKNVDTIINDDFAKMSSVRFSSFRLLDQLQSLFPGSLKWIPYGASAQALYMYTIHLFIAAGLDASDISYACTKKESDGGHNGTFIMRANRSKEKNLYVHFLRDPIFDISTWHWNKMFDKTPNPFEMKHNEYNVKLGGFVFASTPTNGTCHAISGFRHMDNQYIYNGYPSRMDHNSHVFPCPPIISPNWTELFSGTPYYIRHHICGMHITSTQQSDILFEYPFRGYFGLGVVSKSEIQENPTEENPTEDAYDYASPALFIDYVESYQLDIAEQIYEISGRVGTMNTDKVNRIYALLKNSQSIVRVGFLYQLSIDWNIHELEKFILLLLNKLLYYSHIMAGGRDVCELCKTMFTDTKKYMKDWFDSVHTNVIVYTSYDWVVDIIIYVTAKMYAESEDSFSDEINYYKHREENMRFRVSRIFRAINAVYLPIGIVNQLLRKEENQTLDQPGINSWIYGTVCATVNESKLLGDLVPPVTVPVTVQSGDLTDMTERAKTEFQRVVEYVGSKLKSWRKFPLLHNVRILENPNQPQPH
jgi:hypothetical protein